MPAKIPFVEASESLQQRWREASSSPRVAAQVCVLVLLLTIGALRHYLGSSKRSSSFGSATAQSLPGARDETLGEIDAIYIYPIKSCAGVSVDAVELTEQGFDLDRRWLVMRSKRDGFEKLSLREEPRLTLIQPEFDEQANLLRLALTEAGSKEPTANGLGETATPLRPSLSQLRGWETVRRISMYGDFADGRIAPLSPMCPSVLSPSEWLTRLLGYPAILVHFDTSSSTKRDAFPIFKPPSDAQRWSDKDLDELERKRSIEFQDEYPLLVASVESLESVRDQLGSALGSTNCDGRGGRAITGIDARRWSDRAALSMARFRPNVVLKGVGKPFSEDSWERLWILASTTSRGPAQAESHTYDAMLQLVARCQRCLLTAVDPVTADKDPSVPLKLLNRSRMRVKKPDGFKGGNGRAGPCFGMYAIPLPLTQNSYGKVSTGHRIRVRWRPFAMDDEPERTKQ